ncbi:MAG TPA: CPBP family intramembrane glutamic endopeptidase [Ruminiclostridium sp.]|nr:CPBP family intramembrane glutamic endopeptidase [Ruminiclostridium sp.]
MITKYQELARTGDTRPSRFVSSVSVILYLYFWMGGIIASIPLIYVLITNRGAWFDPVMSTDIMGFLNKYVSPMPNYIFTNLSIYCMLLGVFISVRYIHNRPFLTLINDRAKIKWSRFFIGFTVFGILLSIGTIVDYFLSPETYSVTFDASKFWLAFPIILLMTPLQTATEELVFRGYVIQGFGLKIKNGIILSVISGALFTLPHLANPEIYASNKLGVLSTICMILNYFVMGMMLATITIRTNSLEAAIGAHTVNNLFCFLAVGYPDSALPTNTVFFTTNFEPVSGLVSTILTAVLFYFITAMLIKKPQQESSVSY